MVAIFLFQKIIVDAWIWTYRLVVFVPHCNENYTCFKTWPGCHFTDLFENLQSDEHGLRSMIFPLFGCVEHQIIWSCLEPQSAPAMHFFRLDFF